MAVAVMTNPPPGLRANPLPLAVVGNPRRIPTPPQDRRMTPKQKKAFAAKMKAARAAKSKARTPAAKKASTQARTVRRAKRKTRAIKRAKKRTVKRTSAIIVSTRQPTARKVTKTNPGKRRRKTRRNPGAAGFLSDVTGCFSELKNLSKPEGMMFAGAGAASAMVLGSVLAPTIAKFVPAVSQPIARGLNAATYALAGLPPALLIKDSGKRRKFILGVLGVALSEGIFPGWSAAVLGKVPVIKGLIPKPPVSKALADADTTLQGLDGLAGFGRRPIGGYFATVAKLPSKTRSLKDDLSGIMPIVSLALPFDASGIPRGQAQSLAADLIDRPGALAADLIDRPGALADSLGGLRLGAFA